MSRDPTGTDFGEFKDDVKGFTHSLEGRLTDQIRLAQRTADLARDDSNKAHQASNIASIILNQHTSDIAELRKGQNATDEDLIQVEKKIDKLANFTIGGWFVLVTLFAILQAYLLNHK